MPQKVRLWEISDDSNLEEVTHAKLNYEDRIESWLEIDISIISNDLLVIGRQVGTDYGGIIDILCLDHNGDVVIVELKRDKTPRDITAQLLDYGSWVNNLSYDKISEIGSAYFSEKNTTLEEAYQNKFEEEYPDTVNENHRMLIVASEIDSSTERIVKYLSDLYDVGINVVTFDYFKNADGKEYLSRIFLIDPTKEFLPKSKKKAKSLSFEDFQEMADNNGVGDLYRKALEKLRPLFYTITRHVTGISIKGKFKEKKSPHSIMVIYPYFSSAEKGLSINIYVDRLAHYCNIEEEKIVTFLSNLSPSDSDGHYFRNEDIDHFVSILTEKELN